MRTKSRPLYSLGLATCVAATLLPASRASAQEREREADLSVEIVRGPRRVRVGERVQYRVEITNHGPDTARGVRVRVAGSDELEFIRSRCRAVFSGPRECIFRDLEPDETVTAIFTVEIGEPVGDGPRRQARLRVRAEAQTFDPQLEDNSERRTLRIVGRPDGGDFEGDRERVAPTSLGADGRELDPMDLLTDEELVGVPGQGEDGPQPAGTGTGADGQAPDGAGPTGE